jgi:peroxiredoxin
MKTTMVLASLTAAIVISGAPVSASLTRGYVDLPKAGDRAPDFTLSNLDGDKVTLSQYSPSKGVVLWFTNLCGGCQKDMPLLEKLHEKYKNGSVEFLAISQLGNDVKAVEKVVTKSKPTFQFLIDPKGSVSKLYSGEYIPGTCPLQNIFFIGRDGKIKSSTHFPGVSPQELERELRRIAVSGKTKVGSDKE